ncbi:RNA polymerase sigma factor [Pyxidicoccus sp. 3LG]
MARLALEGREGEQAREELRALLVAGVRRALAARRPEALAWAEDFAQEGLMRVLAGHHTWRGEGRFTSWALGVCLRVAFDELRRRWWRDRSLEGTAGGTEAPVEMVAADTPERELARRRVLTALRDAVEQDLTPHQRGALSLELEGMPQVAVAERLGLSRGAIYKLSYDARRKLRQALEREGLTAEQVQWAFEEEATS